MVGNIFLGLGLLPERVWFKYCQQHDLHGKSTRGTPGTQFAGHLGRKRVMGPDQVEGARQQLAAGDKLAHPGGTRSGSRQTVYAYPKS